MVSAKRNATCSSILHYYNGLYLVITGCNDWTATLRIMLFCLACCWAWSIYSIACIIFIIILILAKRVVKFLSSLFAKLEISQNWRLVSAIIPGGNQRSSVPWRTSFALGLKLINEIVAIVIDGSSFEIWDCRLVILANMPLLHCFCAFYYFLLQFFIICLPFFEALVLF